MFDEIRWLSPLPCEDGWFDASKIVFQTKDTPEQYLDLYEVRDDGTIWQKIYNRDQSDKNAPEIWEPMPTYSDCVRFYKHEAPDSWIEFEAIFIDGKLYRVKLIENRNWKTKP